MLKIISLMAFLSVSLFALHTGEINLNDKDLEIGARLDMGQFIDNVEPDTTFVGGKFLNASEDNSGNKNVNLDPYAEVNFLMMRAIGDKGVKLGMGVKLNYTKDYSTMPIGVEFDYKMPFSNLIPMYLNGSVYYAPQVLSFIQAKHYLEYRIGYDFELIENGKITVGYRAMDTDYKNYNFSYNSSIYFGFKISF